MFAMSKISMFILQQILLEQSILRDFGHERFNDGSVIVIGEWFSCLGHERFDDGSVIVI